MALIDCPHCGSPISDRATTCPKCGAELQPAEKEEKEELVVCEECGESFDKSLDACPSCGCPVAKEEPAATVQKVDVSNVSVSMGQGVRKKVILALVAIAVALAGGFVFKRYQDAEAQKQAAAQAAEYAGNLETAANEMLVGAIAAEQAGGMIHDVWYNTVFEKSDSRTDEYTKSNTYSSSFNDDFNTSIANYMLSEDYLALKASITDSQESVKGYMKKLKNPPADYTEAYDSVKELYEAYNDIVSCAINPSGNLTSYTSTFNEADSEFSKKYDSVKLLLE